MKRIRSEIQEQFNAILESMRIKNAEVLSFSLNNMIADDLESPIFDVIFYQTNELINLALLIEINEIT